MRENEHHFVSQHATIMSSLVKQKQRFNILEAECSMLQNLAFNLRKDSLSSTSNKDKTNSAQAKLKEEETVHQRKELMSIEQQLSPLPDAGQEEAHSLHVFH